MRTSDALGPIGRMYVYSTSAALLDAEVASALNRSFGLFLHPDLVLCAHPDDTNLAKLLRSESGYGKFLGCSAGGVEWLLSPARPGGAQIYAVPSYVTHAGT